MIRTFIQLRLISGIFLKVNRTFGKDPVKYWRNIEDGYVIAGVLESSPETGSMYYKNSDEPIF
jgi:hypothetical protein